MMGGAYAPTPMGGALPHGQPSVMHGRALIRQGRCSACAEPLPGGSLFRRETCRCGQATYLHPAAQTELEGSLQGSLTLRIGLLLAGVVAAQLLLGWIPLLGSVLLGLCAVLLRFWLTEPVARLLSPKRRLVLRWTTRLFLGVVVAFSVVGAELLTAIPILGLIGKAGVALVEAAVVGVFSHRYAFWQLRRERSGESVAAWEWLLLIGVLAFFAVAAILMLGAIFVAISLLESAALWLTG